MAGLADGLPLIVLKTAQDEVDVLFVCDFEIARQNFGLEKSPHFGMTIHNVSSYTAHEVSRQSDTPNEEQLAGFADYS